MEYLELSASTRTETGNGPARRLRVEGRCPAILYGAKAEPVMMSIHTHDFELSLKRGGGTMAFFNLTIEGHDGGKRLAIVKELQRDPVSAQLVHVDFYEIDMNRKLTVKIPVHTVGKCKGVEFGGLLQVIRRELEVSCLPSNIPAAIELDITELGVGEAIHVEDIQLADGVEIPHDVNFTVITVLSPKKDVADEEDDEGEDEDAAKVAVTEE
ncbi:MAG: 50S ribosomal protein L25 [Pseudomonadota bacterium]